MRKLAALFFVAWMVACGAPSTPVESAASFSAPGLKLVVGVDRPKTFVVQPDGLVVSESGNALMKFADGALQLPDGSKTVMSYDGEDLRGPEKSIGRVDAEGLTIGDVHIAIKDDGTVTLDQNGSTHKMRMHFEGAVVGKKRPALMLVAFVFGLSAAMHPHAALEQFYDD